MGTLKGRAKSIETHPPDTSKTITRRITQGKGTGEKRSAASPQGTAL